MITGNKMKNNPLNQAQFAHLIPHAGTMMLIDQVASWSTLADYVFEKQGTELVIPRTRAYIEPVSTGARQEVKPFIQIFQGGSTR